ncbi:hypothetical protein EC973_005673 [Apophysomyces ossiformis]|uniref:Uncharacterized protein n=1 Tax=Apophysomyces ossiformis TaxID=679940 RepID=A0A8H7BF40_9FUNG|nr:hypothetical protein EC973_005673 [Apophysomyces ossiformis]
MDSSTDVLVRLITELGQPKPVPEANAGTRYLVLNLVEAAESKWPGAFQMVLEKVFSKAIAVHIADSEGSVNIEKILANLAMLYEKDVHGRDRFDTRPGFHIFKSYMASHWKQVLLLFVNHPSIECQVMGYNLLSNARFWEREPGNVEAVDPQVLSKILMDSWFRHMKNQYIHCLEGSDHIVLDKIQHLIEQCCLQTTLSKAILGAALDGILDGALEIFPKTDARLLSQAKISILDKIRRSDTSKRNDAFGKHPRPPQFVTKIDILIPELDIRDKIYIDNIQRTASLFYKSAFASLEDSKTISLHILSHLTSKWPRDIVSFDIYDEVLPKNIPYVSTPLPTSDIIRSVLVYFIAFWHMAEVSTVSTALQYSTQLEETIRIIGLLEAILPESLFHSRRLLPFMSGKDIGDILYQVIWPCVRSHYASGIPGLSARAQEISRTDIELEAKGLRSLTIIYERRLKTLEIAPTWGNALKQVGDELNLGRAS